MDRPRATAGTARGRQAADASDPTPCIRIFSSQAQARDCDRSRAAVWHPGRRHQSSRSSTLRERAGDCAANPPTLRRAYHGGELEAQEVAQQLRTIQSAAILVAMDGVPLSRAYSCAMARAWSVCPPTIASSTTGACHHSNAPYAILHRHVRSRMLDRFMPSPCGSHCPGCRRCHRASKGLAVARRVQTLVHPAPGASAQPACAAKQRSVGCVHANHAFVRRHALGAHIFPRSGQRSEPFWPSLFH